MTITTTLQGPATAPVSLLFEEISTEDWSQQDTTKVKEGENVATWMDRGGYLGLKTHSNRNEKKGTIYCALILSTSILKENDVSGEAEYIPVDVRIAFNASSNLDDWSSDNMMELIGMAAHLMAPESTGVPQVTSIDSLRINAPAGVVS